MCEGECLGSAGHCSRWGVTDQLDVVVGAGGRFPDTCLVRKWVSYKLGLSEL